MPGGRYLVAYPEQSTAILGAGREGRAPADMSLDEIVAHRVKHLTGYQDKRLAQKYERAVARLRDVETRVTRTETLTRAVAITYAKVLAYKDEYEVARLYVEPDFQNAVRRTFEGRFTLSFHLAPPLLARMDENSGRPRKIRVGRWILPAFRVLAALRGLRGTWFDPFGRSEERRRERDLITIYEDGLTTIAARLAPETHVAALALASAPDMVRGFGPVKMAAFKTFDAEWKKRIDHLENGRLPKEMAL